jgi:hypothetical protein
VPCRVTRLHPERTYTSTCNVDVRYVLVSPLLPYEFVMSVKGSPEVDRTRRASGGVTSSESSHQITLRVGTSTYSGHPMGGRTAGQQQTSTVRPSLVAVSGPQQLASEGSSLARKVGLSARTVYTSHDSPLGAPCTQNLSCLA